MAHRVELLNKKTGITYVYESQPYWDKEKKQARSKRVCIGKLDPKTGVFIPSKTIGGVLLLRYLMKRSPPVPRSSDRW